MDGAGAIDESDEICRIVGAAMDVHRELHGGLLEPPYQDALEIELGLRGIPFIREAPLPIFYKGQKLRSAYRPTSFVSATSWSNSRHPARLGRSRKRNC